VTVTGTRHTVVAFVRLRWRLLGASLRGRGPETAGVVLSTAASIVVGAGAGIVLAVAGRSAANDSDLFVLVCALGSLLVLSLSVIAGVTQPIDPRVLATEPLSDHERALGLLAATCAGPPGLAGILVGAGLAVGAVRGTWSVPVVLAAVLTWLVVLLLVSRAAANVLGLLATRSPRAGQLIVALTALVFYGGVQFVPSTLAAMDADRRAGLASVLAATPPGQLGRALGAADRSTPAALAHLVAGAVVVPALFVLHGATARRLTESVRSGRNAVDRGTADESGHTAMALGWVADAARRACGRGAAGAIAWRSVLTRLRTPRTAVETFTGAGVGMAAVLVPALTRDGVGGGAVLVGGAVQLAVLFMAGNSFGNDGPPLAMELLAGASPKVLASGKARSITVVAAPLAIAGPLLAAAVSGQWAYLPAGILVGAGAVLAGTAGAVVQSAYVPVAVADSDNPFASGESGRGFLAALLLGAVLVGLAVVTLPVGLALLWAHDRGSVATVTALGALTVAVGWAIRHAAVGLAARRIGPDGATFLQAVTPAR
jgi:ABC-2 type transport system permease protein